MGEYRYVWFGQTFIGRFAVDSPEDLRRIIGVPAAQLRVVSEGELDSAEWARVDSIMRA